MTNPDGVLPKAEEQPVIDLWPDAGRACRLGRSATYDAAKRGDIPTIRLGRRVVVPTARLRALLGLDGGPDAAA
jgi:hypothetical protein